MKRLAISVVASGFLLASCGTAEWKEEQELGDAAFEKKDYATALQHYEASYELKELSSTEDKIEEVRKKKEAEDKKIALEKEKKKKEEAEQKAREQEDKEKREKNNAEKREKSDALHAKMDELVVASEGLILKVEPWKEHDWETVRVYVADEWYLLDEGEKKYLVEQIGPGFAALVAQSGLENDPAIYFYDKNMKELAKPNIWSGGWKIKN